MKAEKVGEQDVKFTFDQPGNRELPQIVGQLMVLPKHWWEGTDKDGKKRDISATTLEPPLGSGPYRVKEFSARPHPGARARQGLLGREAAGQRRPGQLRRAALRILPRQRRGAGSLQGRPGRLDHREQRQAVGDAYEFPAVREKRVVHARNSRCASSGRMQGVRLQPAPRSVQGCALPPGIQLCLRLRGDEQAAVLRPVQAHQQLFRRHRACQRKACRKARSSRYCETVRGRVPEEVFTTAYTNPVNGNAGERAQQPPRERCAC